NEPSMDRKQDSDGRPDQREQPPPFQPDGPKAEDAPTPRKQTIIKTPPPIKTPDTPPKINRIEPEPPDPFEALAPECEKYLSEHRFSAVKSTEIVPGDMVCDMFFDGQMIEVRATTGKGQAQVKAALVTWNSV